jgi:hypothetical protein
VIEPVAPELWVGHCVAPDGRTVARAGLGLTAYLDEPLHWARGGAFRALERFLATTPRHYLTQLSTSYDPAWRLVREADHPDILRALDPHAVVTPTRHLFRVRLAQDYGAPSLGFSYTEVDPARGSRSAVIELTWPEAFDPQSIVDAAHELATDGPCHSIVGGVVFRWDERYRAAAFDQLYRWAHRYCAVDIQDAEEMAWRTPTGLPGMSWITYVSDAIAGPAELDVARAAEGLLDVSKWRAGRGTFLQAGPAPVQGDLNRLVVPKPYLEVARRLAPLFVPKPPKFWGPFHEDGVTDLWFRRFLELEQWIDHVP